jgi:competence protein ComEA
VTAAFCCAALAAASLSAAAPQRAAKKGLAPGERIDLNRCSAAELMRLPGIGRKRAEAVIARRARAPYRRVEDVVAVKGISRRWLEKNRAHLTVGATPARVAPASAARPDARAGAPR